MKKQIFLLLIICTFYCKVNAQLIVMDPTVIFTLAHNHSEQQSVLNSIDKSEKDIRNYQALITLKMQEIQRLQEKTMNYLSTVNAVVKNGKDIIYASDIAKDIYKYQKQAGEVAKGNSELLLVVAKTELELISRSTDLMLHIYQVALASGEKNLLDNKQRIDLCTYVVKELQMMRALAYSVVRQIKAAKRDGVIKALNPKTFRYVANCERIKDKILRDIEFIKKGGY